MDEDNNLGRLDSAKFMAKMNARLFRVRVWLWLSISALILCALNVFVPLA